MNKFTSSVFFIIIFSLFSHLGSCIPVDISSPSSFSSPNDLTTEVTSSSQSPSSSTSSHHSSSSSISSHERTLLITQKWLIDNINLLRREMSEMARDYNLHIDANKQEANRKETEFARDVDSLRADHTLLARNQLKIINLIKSSNQGQHGSTSETNSNENNIQNENTIHETSTSENTEHSHKSRKNLRHLVYDLMKVEANFEHETKHNLSSVSSQLAALHEITLSLYQDLKDLKSKIRSVDFDQL